MPPKRKSSRINKKPSSICISLDESSSPQRETPNTSEVFIGKEESCLGCEQEDPPKFLSRIKQVAWIQCDLCNKWWHSICARYTEEEVQKITNNNKFSCAFCVIQQHPILEVASKTVLKQELEHSNITNPAASRNKELVTKVSNILEITECLATTTLNKNQLDNLDKDQLETKSNPTRGKEIKQSQIEDIVIIDNLEHPEELRNSRTIHKKAIRNSNFSQQS